MKTTALILFATLSAAYSHAQITLTASFYTTAVAGTTDTVETITPSTIPSLATGAAQTWDFTNVTFDQTVYNHHVDVPSGVFTGVAGYADAVADSIGYTYYFNEITMNGVSANGIVCYGRHYDLQSESMGFFSGNPNDTFQISTQDELLSHQRVEVAFPATYMSTWQSNDTFLIDGVFDVAAMSYSDKPFQFHRTYTSRDTVTGWGTMKLKNSAGIVCNIPVLQVHDVTYSFDETFVDGSEITESQKDYMGVPRNSSGYADNEYRYYTVDEVTPIVAVSYNGSGTANYGRLLSKAYPSSGVNDVTNDGGFAVYPNPVTDKTFVVSVSAAQHAYTYDVVNVAGKTICNGRLTAGENKIELPLTTAAGSYYLQISEGNRNVVATQKIIVR